MPRPAIHPGEILRDELAEIGITPTELSRQINVPPNRVTEIIHGRRSVTGDTALRLGHWFGSSPRFWLNLQSAYDIRAAEERVGPKIKQLRRRLKDETDTARLDAMTEADIAKAVADDPDAAPIDIDWTKARLTLPGKAAAAKKRKAKKAAPKPATPAKRRA